MSMKMKMKMEMCIIGLSVDGRWCRCTCCIQGVSWRGVDCGQFRVFQSMICTLFLLPFTMHRHTRTHTAKSPSGGVGINHRVLLNLCREYEKKTPIHAICHACTRSLDSPTKPSDGAFRLSPICVSSKFIPFCSGIKKRIYTNTTHSSESKQPDIAVHHRLFRPRVDPKRQGPWSGPAPVLYIQARHVVQAQSADRVAIPYAKRL